MGGQPEELNAAIAGAATFRNGTDERGAFLFVMPSFSRLNWILILSTTVVKISLVACNALAFISSSLPMYSDDE